MKTLINHCVCVLVILGFLTSCSAPASSVGPAIPTSTLLPTVVPSSIPTMKLPTVTPVLKPTTSTPASELPTDTPVLKPTPTASALRATPAPTLTDDEEQTLVLDLLKKNGECQLPCWWGFTPGKTSWQIAESFFVSAGKKIGKYRDSQTTIYTIYFHIPLHGSQINQDYYTVNDDTIDVITISAVPPTRNGELVYGDAQFARDWRSYTLPQLLTDYGQPQQIFLRTFSDTPTGWLPFNLLLFYPEQGILVSYYGPAEKDKGTLRACLNQTDVRLWLWSPEHTMSLERLANMGSSPIGNMAGFRRLEEATGMSVEQFYQSFVQPNNKRCLETPADMW